MFGFDDLEAEEERRGHEAAETARAKITLTEPGSRYSLTGDHLVEPAMSLAVVPFVPPLPPVEDQLAPVPALVPQPPEVMVFLNAMRRWQTMEDMTGLAAFADAE